MGRALEHTCDHPGCNADAPFGFGVGSIRKALEGKKGQLGLWSCAKHRIEVELQLINRGQAK